MLTDETFVSVPIPLIFSDPINSPYNPYETRVLAIIQLHRSEFIGIRTPSTSIESLGRAAREADLFEIAFIRHPQHLTSISPTYQILKWY